LTIFSPPSAQKPYFREDHFSGGRPERLGIYSPPDIIIGEAKSLGEGDLIKSKDLEKLRIISRKFPGAIVVISVLRGQVHRLRAEDPSTIRQVVQEAR
jgi:hypothetical protein